MTARRVTLERSGRCRVGDDVVVNVHNSGLCAGRTCVMHNPSDHPMMEWPLLFDAETLLVKRRCPHGATHPDPDSLAYFVSVGARHVGVHTCDGCCAVDTLGEARALAAQARTAAASVPDQT